MATQYRVIEDDLGGTEVAALLRLHLDEMHRWPPADKVHAMPIERLRAADVTFYSAWVGETLAAVGAIKHLVAARGELKSMRAAPDYRGQGAGCAILLHLLAVAGQRGYTWLGLETGVPDEFLPARRLYESHGFAECPAFAGYVSDEWSMCMSRTL